MTELLIKILNMSMIASVVAIGVMLVRLPLKKAPKLFSYLLWGLVLFKLVCPLTIESVKALIPVNAEPIPQTIITAPVPQIDSGIRIVDSAINEVLSAAPATPAASANPIQIILEIAAWVWAVGAVALFFYAFISYFILKYRMKTAIKSGDAFESDRVSTAFVLGFFSPKIYLPAHLSLKEREYILLHEQTHIKHFDYVVKPIAYAAACLHWFNPLVWLSYKLAMQDMELTCDETVLRHYDTDIRADYSRSLLSLSQKRSGLLSPLAFSETGVKPRIKNALNYKKPAFWIMIASVVLITAAAIIFLPNAANAPAASKPPESAASSTSSDIAVHTPTILADAKVFQIAMPNPDEEYLKTLYYDGTASSDWIESAQEFQNFSADLKQHFALDTSQTNALAQYDDTFFKSNRVIAMILAKDNNLDCTFGGIRDYSSGAITRWSKDIKTNDFYVFIYFESSKATSNFGIEINWTATDRAQTEENAWWLVLINVDAVFSNKLSACDQIAARWSSGGGEKDNEIISETKTVSYYKDGTSFTDTYVIKSKKGSEFSLYNDKDQFMLKAKDFMLMPYLIGALQSDGWHLYKKAEMIPSILVPASDYVYEELAVERYPDGYTNASRMLAKRGGFWALLDNYGNELTEAVYDQIQYYSYEECRQVVCVVREGKYGAIDYNGNIIIEPVYVYISTLIYDDYDKDTYFVYDGNRWGILQLEADLTPNPPDWTAKVPQNVIASYEREH